MASGRRIGGVRWSGGLLLVLLFGVGVGAQALLRPYSITKWDRMPSATVYAIAQTKDGYLWLGTADGLVRFDGFGFVQVPLPGDGGAVFGRVLALAAGDGGLWIGTEDGKLLRMQGQTFRVAHVVNAVSGIRVSAAAGVEVLTARMVYRYSPSTLQPLASCVSDVPERLPCKSAFLPSVPSRVLAGAQVSQSQVAMTVRDRQDNVWLATKDHGLYRVLDSSKPGSPQVEHITVADGLSSDAVR